MARIFSGTGSAGWSFAKPEKIGMMKQSPLALSVTFVKFYLERVGHANGDRCFSEEWSQARL
jgi:hypothetical protein